MTSRVCSTPSCPTFTDQSRCPGCRRDAERARGTVTQRGYGHTHRTRFRAAVLSKHPNCQLCHQQPSTVADHFPRSRRELVEANLNPNDPAYGRGLCATCHGRHTAQTQPGGWNNRDIPT